MAQREPEVAESTSVTIYGRVYDLRGGEDRAYLQTLASIVDSKMREVAEATGTADTLKVAILASLNLADEYLQASEAAPGTNREASKRLAQLVTRLDEALAESGTASPC